ncbi:MAG TPA: head GIN domain-containing protein [Chitinophagaceae bacterium]|jgi:hypothetical protein
MKNILFLLLAALPLALAAQDKVINDPDAQARVVGPFHAIKVSTGIQLIIKQGATDAVAVSASDKETRDHIKTEVVNGVLKIYFDIDFWSEIKTFKNRKLKAYVSLKEIDGFSGSSGSNTTVDGSISAGRLTIDLSSGAYFKGDIKANNLSVSQGSGSHGDMSGQAQALTVKTHSGAHFAGYGIASSECNADAHSGGKIEITVNKELVAEASSGGGIFYKGVGLITHVSTSSGGRIKRDS